MTTWISKSVSILLAATVLTGCDAQPMSFMANLPSFGKKGKVPVTTAVLGRGAVALVAPDGYCIDPGALKLDFALLARCDALGVEDSASTRPFALMTVSIAPVADGAVLPTAQEIAAIKGLDEPKKPLEEGKYVIFAASGTPPAEGLADGHWRGMTVVNGHVMGIALFRGKNNPRISSEGAAIIEDLIEKTQSVN